MALCQGRAGLLRVSELSSCPGGPRDRSHSTRAPSDPGGHHLEGSCRHMNRASHLAGAHRTRLGTPPSFVARAASTPPLPAPGAPPFPAVAPSAEPAGLPGEADAVTSGGGARTGGRASALYDACLHGGGILQLAPPPGPSFFKEPGRGRRLVAGPRGRGPAALSGRGRGAPRRPDRPPGTAGTAPGLAGRRTRGLGRVRLGLPGESGAGARQAQAEPAPLAVPRPQEPPLLPTPRPAVPTARRAAGSLGARSGVCILTRPAPSPPARAHPPGGAPRAAGLRGARSAFRSVAKGPGFGGRRAFSPSPAPTHRRGREGWGRALLPAAGAGEERSRST